MHADQMRLRQALLNLMSNANKFTEKGTVTIAARQGQENGRDWVTLSVADTGIGMTAEQMGKLFRSSPRPRRPRRASTAAQALALPSAGISAAGWAATSRLRAVRARARLSLCDCRVPYLMMDRLRLRRRNEAGSGPPRRRETGFMEYRRMQVIQA